MANVYIYRYPLLAIRWQEHAKVGADRLHRIHPPVLHTAVPVQLSHDEAEIDSVTARNFPAVQLFFGRSGLARHRDPWSFATVDTLFGPKGPLGAERIACRSGTHQLTGATA